MVEFDLDWEALLDILVQIEGNTQCHLSNLLFKCMICSDCEDVALFYGGPLRSVL